MDIVSGGVAEGQPFSPRQIIIVAVCLSLPRVRPSAKTLCRVPDYLPSAKGHALGKDALSGSAMLIWYPTSETQDGLDESSLSSDSVSSLILSLFGSTANETLKSSRSSIPLA